MRGRRWLLRRVGVVPSLAHETHFPLAFVRRRLMKGHSIHSRHGPGGGCEVKEFLDEVLQDVCVRLRARATPSGRA